MPSLRGSAPTYCQTLGTASMLKANYPWSCPSSCHPLSVCRQAEGKDVAPPETLSLKLRKSNEHRDLQNLSNACQNHPEKSFITEYMRMVAHAAGTTVGLLVRDFRLRNIPF